jgi:hypothetical protein
VHESEFGRFNPETLNLPPNAIPTLQVAGDDAPGEVCVGGRTLRLQIPHRSPRADICFLRVGTRNICAATSPCAQRRRTCQVDITA